jgi:hypothetical protein
MESKSLACRAMHKEKIQYVFQNQAMDPVKHSSFTKYARVVFTKLKTRTEKESMN